MEAIAIIIVEISFSISLQHDGSPKAVTTKKIVLDSADLHGARSGRLARNPKIFRILISYALFRLLVDNVYPSETDFLYPENHELLDP